MESRQRRRTGCESEARHQRLRALCAGLGAHNRRHAEASRPRAYFAKGNYFALKGARSPFKHLVYPMPEAAGIGIHATLDLGGAVRFGPDVEWIETVDYAVDESRAPLFEEAIRHYWPGLSGDALAPSYCGIRPKIAGPGEPSADFMIQGPDDHGAEGLWNLFGIEFARPHRIARFGRGVVRANNVMRSRLFAVFYGGSRLFDQYTVAIRSNLGYEERPLAAAPRRNAFARP